jgi:cullin-associated NEDD8-dissociated protein 1
LVAGLLDKMTNPDSDFRFMATNDLLIELNKEQFALDNHTEPKVIDAILKQLTDSNSEVQNVAIKCLSPLSKKIRKVLYACQKIVDLLNDQGDSVRDIAALGLKTMLQSIPADCSEIPQITGFLIPALLVQLKKVKAPLT